MACVEATGRKDPQLLSHTLPSAPPSVAQAPGWNPPDSRLFRDASGVSSRG